MTRYGGHYDLDCYGTHHDRSRTFFSRLTELKTNIFPVITGTRYLVAVSACGWPQPNHAYVAKGEMSTFNFQTVGMLTVMVGCPSDILDIN